MKKRRIKAFTLIEMVLAMMLAAIVMSMAYTVFTIFSRLYSDYRIKNLDHANLQLIRLALGRDMECASLAEVDENGLHLKDSLRREEVSYTPSGDYLLRRAGTVTDSLRMKDLKMYCSFEGSDVSEGITDYLVLKFIYHKKPMEISIHRNYSSAELLTYQDPDTDD
ncbi:type II secretion system protein [Pedobacter panaciterrae]|uniref:PulJ/GspJ family protein n=1 Tax=Pedobacter panaciterrae TaxID=363849 RepID=UPI00155D990D|nr:type II secretion system protein [Pedobacter panaciterrae]NQX52075.1 type II secretion system protein [Pedobacter panaciterrae]